MSEQSIKNGLKQLNSTNIVSMANKNQNRFITRFLEEKKGTNFVSCKKGAGFTMVELLVVVGIVCVLFILVAIVLNYAKVQSRDTIRIANIKQIQAALELYYLYNNDYPDMVAEGGKIGSYMKYVPKDPLPNRAKYVYTVCNNSAVCGDGNIVPIGERASYTLTYRLEGKIGNIGSGRHTATPYGIMSD